MICEENQRIGAVRGVCCIYQCILYTLQESNPAWRHAVYVQDTERLVVASRTRARARGAPRSARTARNVSRTCTCTCRRLFIEN
eukprot:COSAG02_NODE_35862_length_462_cov_0.975207_1_plen_83_part_01